MSVYPVTCRREPAQNELEEAIYSSSKTCFWASLYVKKRGTLTRTLIYLLLSMRLPSSNMWIQGRYVVLEQASETKGALAIGTFTEVPKMWNSTCAASLRARLGEPREICRDFQSGHIKYTRTPQQKIASRIRGRSRCINTALLTVPFKLALCTNTRP